MRTTPGNWRLGRHKDTVITDHIADTHMQHVENYGGQVIAESILNEADRHLISAAPEMLAVLEDLERDTLIKLHESSFWKRFYIAVRKARGESE